MTKPSAKSEDGICKALMRYVENREREKKIMIVRRIISGVWLVLAGLLVATPVAASPVSLQCTIKGDGADIFGRLAVEVDLEALSVKIEAPEKMPGIRWEYRNGQVGRILTRGPPEVMRDTEHPMTMPVMQFVRLTPQFVVLGWRTPNDEPGTVSSFNRSALNHHPAPCVWHRAAEFDRA